MVLQAVIEEFVTRDGTDNSSVEQRIKLVLHQLDVGIAERHFQQETETCNILPMNEGRDPVGSKSPPTCKLPSVALVTQTAVAAQYLSGNLDQALTERAEVHATMRRLSDCRFSLATGGSAGSLFLLLAVFRVFFH